MARQVVFVEIMEENVVLKKSSLQMKILLRSIKINRNKFTPKIWRKVILNLAERKDYLQRDYRPTNLSSATCTDPKR